MFVPVLIQMIEDPGDQEWMADLYTKYYKLMISTSNWTVSVRLSPKPSQPISLQLSGILRSPV